MLAACTAVVAIAFAAPTSAAEAKRPFSHEDFDAWRTITGQVISRDGRFLAYAYMPLEGDGDVLVRDLSNDHEDRIPVGALPPPPLTPSERDPERPAPRREVSITLTSDSRFAVANFFPTQSETLQAKRAGKKPADLPRESIVIIALEGGKVARIPGVKNHQVPSNGGAWLAYLKLAASPAGSAPETTATPGATQRGSELVLRNLATSAERSFPNVGEYSFARDGQTLVFTTVGSSDAERGVFALTPGDPAAPTALLTGGGTYLKFVWNRPQTAAAFLGDRAEGETTPTSPSLYYWLRGAPRAEKVLTADASGIPSGWILSREVAPAFSFDGGKLFVATRPAPKAPDPRLATLLDEEKVHLDLWRWNDEAIQTLQKVNAEKDRKRSYLGALTLADRRFLQLADPTLGVVTFNDAGSLAFGFDDRPYRPRIDYDGIFHDLYLVDATSGARKLIVNELGENASVRWSHNNRWIAYYADRQWFAVDSRDGSVHPLSNSLPYPVYNEQSDLPEMPGPYGSAGWTADGESLLIYDRFDVWQTFPDGRPARNVTHGYGRQEGVALRLQPIDANVPGDERRGVDLGRPLYFRGEHEKSRDTGFFRLAVGQEQPVRLLWAAKDYRYVGRSLGADRLLLTGSRFDEYPDLLLTDANFAAPRKVSNGAAQLAPYLWGSAELINYRSTDGVELSGMLCKPANFDPSRTYPMIVYMYERLSANVNRLFTPAPLAVIDPSFYTSNGYLVLMPDIVYTTGHPGRSAYRCVMPAVDAVVARGYVDENAIGLEGHSWGGYETSYLITQTNRFKAAEAGAIVSNMTSASGGIGWSSGRARLFKYEQNQSRLGATLQDAPLLYLENSPVFFADRVSTPLLILHNDHDDVVPWYQAIEYFLALRRAGKEVYYLNYNDEFHSLRRRADQKDFAKRMHQFFDHFLKGAPAPEWMTKGVPFLDRDEEKLRFRDSP